DLLVTDRSEAGPECWSSATISPLHHPGGGRAPPQPLRAAAGGRHRRLGARHQSVVLRPNPDSEPPVVSAEMQCDTESRGTEGEAKLSV
ncbi:hypothetical protein XENOCAPTIV_014013, partial [Xenoophorus captivus]